MKQEVTREEFEMEKEFTLYPEALALKELGFDEPCFGYFSCTEHIYPIDKHGICTTVNVGDFIENYQFRYLESLFGDKFKHIPAPLYQQAFNFFREKYGGYHGVADDSFLFELTINGEFTRVSSTPKQRRLLNSYEEFETACLREMIEVVKENLSRT